MDFFKSIDLKTSFDKNYKQRVKNKKSNLSGFYKLKIKDRQAKIIDYLNHHSDQNHLDKINFPFNYIDLLSKKKSISTNYAKTQSKYHANLFDLTKQYNTLLDLAIENSISYFPMPMGIATNMMINNSELLIPMVTEEPSIIAACSNAAKITRSGGGVITGSSDNIMFGQIQLRFKNNLYDQKLKQHVTDTLNIERSNLLKLSKDYLKSLHARKGGIKHISYYFIDEIQSCIVLVKVDTLDTMGANKINHLCESLQKNLITLFKDSMKGLAILSNLCTDRIASAKCKIPYYAFHPNKKTALNTVYDIENASLFAQHDVHRATTHNKGIMNGVIAVCLATANDCRAVSAACHSYASLHNKYTPLSNWTVQFDQSKNMHYLLGKLTMPISVGVVGGMTKIHPLAKVNLDILAKPNSRQLAEIIAACGLMQNLAALKALATDGINKNHLKLHNKKSNL